MKPDFVRSLASLAAVCGLVAGSAIFLTTATPAQAEADQGGSTKVRNSGSQAGPTVGFACAAGTQWTNDGGIARCQIPMAPSAVMATCAATNNFGGVGVCRFDLPSVGHGVTVSAPNKLAGYVGTISTTCSNGAWGSITGTCVPIPTVSVTPGPNPIRQGQFYSFDWSSTDATGGSYSCDGANPSSAAIGTSGTQSIFANNLGDTNCSLSVTGPGGNSPTSKWTWTTRAAVGCNSTSIGAASCTYDVPATSSGSNVIGNNTAAGFTGTISASCDDGSFTFGASTCDPLPPSDCAATVLTSGFCSYSFAAIANGGNSTVNNSTAGYTGSMTASCSDGTVSIVGLPTCVVQQPVDCTASVQTFGACSYSFAAIANGASATVNTGTVGYTGTMTASCSNAVVSVTGLPSCTPNPVDCAASTRTYGSCSYDLPLIADGGSKTVSTKTAGYTGSMTAVCSNGAVSEVGLPICQKEPANCTATVKTSGACSFNLPLITSGSSKTVNTSTAGYTGSMKASCSDGTVTVDSSSCNPSPVDCAASTQTSGACSFNFSAINDGGNATVNTNTVGYTGTMTASCAGGSVSVDVASCNSIPPTDCAASTRTSGVCSYALPAIANGGSATVDTSTVDYVGSMTASCSNGVVSEVGLATCDPKPLDCAAQELSSDFCRYSFAALAHAGSATAMNTTPGWRGEATALCSDGVLAFSGVPTCLPDNDPPPPPKRACFVPEVGMIDHGDQVVKRWGVPFGQWEYSTPTDQRCARLATRWFGEGTQLQCNDGTLEDMITPWICYQDGASAGPQGWYWQ